MKRTTLISMLVVGLLLTGSQVFAWPGSQDHRGGHDYSQRSGQRMTDEQRQQRQEQQQEKMAVILDLTESQQKELQALRAQRQEQQQARHTQMQAQREKMRIATTGDEFNEAEFRAMAQQQANQKTDMMVEMAKSRQQIAAVLTPEQQQKWEQLRELKGDNSYGKHGQFRNGSGSDCTSGERSGHRGGQGPRI